MPISAPCHLDAGYELEQFQCGEPALDAWLKQRAYRNEAHGASRTYVIADGNNVIGFYSLAVGSVAHRLVVGSLRRNMPAPIPVMLLGRLAVDLSMQGQGLGRWLLRDAILRTEQAAHIAGIKALLVHAYNKRALHFYTKYGFIASPINELTLMLPLAVIRASLERGHE